MGLKEGSPCVSTMFKKKKAYEGDGVYLKKCDQHKHKMTQAEVDIAVGSGCGCHYGRFRVR